MLVFHERDEIHVVVASDHEDALASVAVGVRVLEDVELIASLDVEQRHQVVVSPQCQPRCRGDAVVRIGSSEALFATLEASLGSVDQIEHDILLRELQARQTPQERSVFVWKAAGYSSEQIGTRLGMSAAAVDTLFPRAKDKVREAFGIEKPKKGTKRLGRPPSKSLAPQPAESDPDVERADGQ